MLFSHRLLVSHIQILPLLYQNFSHIFLSLILHILTFYCPINIQMRSPSIAASCLCKCNIAYNSPDLGNNLDQARCSPAVKESVESELSSTYIERFERSRIEGFQG